MSNVAAAAFCPFISAGRPGHVRLRELHRAGQAARPGEDLRLRRVHEVESRSATPRIRASSSLIMPRVLARLPYGANTKPVDEFGYEEVPSRRSGQGQADARTTITAG